jgi:hypothetical protein
MINKNTHTRRMNDYTRYISKCLGEEIKYHGVLFGAFNAFLSAFGAAAMKLGRVSSPSETQNKPKKKRSNQQINIRNTRRRLKHTIDTLRG